MLETLMNQPHRFQRPTAVIMGMTTNGLSFARSLGRRGIPVVMMESARTRTGMRSRFGRAMWMPDICSTPEAWLQALDDLAGRAASPPVLIPTGDEHVLFVAEHRELLQQRFRFRIPPAGVAETICNKRLQYEFLIARGYPLPKTVFVTADLDHAGPAATTVGFPCVVKPLYSHRWWRQHGGAKLETAADAEQLRRALRLMGATGEPLVLQELIPGDESALHGYLAYYGANGRPVAWFTKQKLRQFPPGFGNGSLQVSTQNAEVAEISARILGEMNYQGLVGVEYKWDGRDRTYKLIEINARSVSGNQLAIDCGIDLPYCNYQEVLGGPVPPAAGYRTGVKWMNLGLDVQALLIHRRSGALSLAEWMRSLAGVRSFALFSARDPCPFFAYLGLALTGLARRGAQLACARTTLPRGDQ